MDLIIQPLTKKIYDKAVSLGVTQIGLHFSGGSDEGYLNVSIQPWNAELSDEVEDWAWGVYEYSGAGDGSEYGDDIIYNIADKTVSGSPWYMARTEGEEVNAELEVAETNE